MTDKCNHMILIDDDGCDPVTVRNISETLQDSYGRVWVTDDEMDIRNRDVTRFSFCPFCGVKLNWEKIVRDWKKAKAKQ